MKTQAEAQKLQQIQEELSQLDASLSNDVAILRGHIEIASAELSEAEYDLCFVALKKSFHSLSYITIQETLCES